MNLSDKNATRDLQHASLKKSVMSISGANGLQIESKSPQACANSVESRIHNLGTTYDGLTSVSSALVRMLFTAGDI